MSGITDRQLAVLRYIARYADANGYPPSVRDVCKEIRGKHTAGVTCHLNALERKGLIKRTPRVARGLVVTDAGRIAVALEISA